MQDAYSDMCFTLLNIELALIAVLTELSFTHRADLNQCRKFGFN